MLRRSLRAFVFGSAILWPFAASAEDNMIYFNCSTQISRGAVTTVYSSGIFLAPNAMYATREFAKAFKEFLISQGLNAPYAGCSTSDTPEKAFKWLDYSEDHARRQKGLFAVVPWAPSNGRVIQRGERPDPPGRKAVTAETRDAGSQSKSSNEKTETVGKTRAEYEAEWQAKLAAHEATVVEYRRKVEAREAEISRQQSEHAAAQEKARQAQAVHEAKMASFNRVLEEQERRQREYEAALALNRQCASGQRQACEAIKTGKPAAEKKLADAGKPMTSDDEARTCVTDPVLGPSKVWKGALAATVVNGCKADVDARICLLREGGWNCGVYWNLKPQQKWTWTSFKATGDLFWDARMAGSGRPLAEP